MAGRKNQGKGKTDAVLGKFYQDSGAEDNEDFTSTVNWATAEEVDLLQKPSNDDRLQAIKEKITNPISDVEIIIPKDKKRLNLIFRNGLNLKDMSNPMFGEEDKTNRRKFLYDIRKANISENKVVVIYAGDLLGVEWELKHLNNAKIITQEFKNGKEAKKALFYGLLERRRALVSDIKFALSQGVEVYLMNGHQEHAINKYFKFDVLQEVVDEINSDKVHYIKGANTIVNVAKQYGNGRKTYATIGFQTNNSKSKARGGQTSVTAAQKVSGENKAKVVFVTNTNTAGKKDTNTYFVSPQSFFKNTPVGHTPPRISNSYNVFSLSIPQSGKINVIEGVNMPKQNPLEQIVYEEYIKAKLLEEYIIKIAAQQAQKIINSERFVSTDYVKELQNAQSRMKNGDKGDNPEQGSN